MIRSNFFEEFGSFDENFFPCWWEDNDMQYRIHLMNKKFYYSNTPIVHYRSQTARFLDFNDVMESGKKYYEEKWGSSNRNHEGEVVGEKYVIPYNDLKFTPKDWEMR